MTLTFRIVSDRINSEATDKKRMKQIASAFQYLGHNTVIGSRNPNAHSHPEKVGATGKNDVFVCVFGGIDIEVLSDHTGYKQSDWFKSRIKKAHIMYIFVKQKGGVDIATAKRVGIAHDGKGNIPGLVSISKPAQFLKNHGITWIQDTTTQGIVNKIRHKNFQGAGLTIDGNKGSTTTTDKENKYTVKHGYNTSTHFEGYLEVVYTVDKSTTPKSILIDFASEAPDEKNKFNNPIGLNWDNNRKYKHEIELLKYIAKNEGNFLEMKNGEVILKTNHKYYLKRVSLVRHFEKQKDDKKTKDVDESKLYDVKKEDSVYKMDIYNLGVSSGEVVTPENLGVSGKSLFDGVKGILDKAKYNYSIIYAPHRCDDKLVFNKVLSTTNIVETFNEGFEGNIIGISNVKYSPTADLINNSVTLYKSTKENGKVSNYRYARKSNLNEILRYGEQTHIESLSDNTGYTEASQEAYDNLQTYYKPDTTFTCTVVGLPPVNVNDYVATKTINPLLTNEYLVASRKINLKVNSRPAIQVEYGLGDIDNTLKIKNNMANQRRELVKTKLDLHEPARYVDNAADNFIEAEQKVWVE